MFSIFALKTEVQKLCFDGEEDTSGEWYLSGKFGALCPEGHRFESHSGRHVGTLGKSFTHSCLLTPTQHQCCSWERL